MLRRPYNSDEMKSRSARSEQFRMTNSALGDAQEHIVALIFQGASREFPSDYKLADEVYEAIEKLRRKLYRRHR